MDDVSISGTLQGMYNGLAQQQDAYGRARFYNSIASQNQYSLGEQQLEAQKNRDFGNMLQRNMTSTPATQPMSSAQPQAQAPMASQTPMASQAPMASQTQTPTQPQQNGLPPLSPSYLRNLPNTGMMGLSQMGSGQPQASAQQPTTPSAQQSTTPSAPANPLKIAGLQAQGQTPTLTPLADHSAVQGFLATTPNAHPDTAKATDKDNPTFASQHVFDAVDPQSGAVVHNTFDRQGLINQMMNYTDKNGNHTMAADANKLMASFTLSDAADEKTKQDAIVAANGKALMLSAGLEYLPADQQAAVYQSLKSRASQAGADVTTWPTGPTDPNFKPWVAQQGEEARMNANTAKEASKRAEDAYNDLKAKAEAGKDQAQGQEAQAKAETDRAQAGYLGAETQTQPSVRNKNNADAFKLYQEGLKAKAEAGNLTAGGTGGVVTKLEDVPAQYQPMVQDLASGKLQISDLPARTGAGQISRNQFISWASQVYPGWDPRLSAQSKKTIMDFAPNGIAGKQVTSFGAVAEHTQMLRQAFDQMNNGNIPALNALAGTVGAAVGNSPKTTYNNMAAVYAGEVDKAFSGNNPTEGGAKTWAHNLNYSMSPKQANDAFNVLDTAVTGKLQPIDQAYYNASGKHLSETNLLTPAAKNLAGKFGGAVNQKLPTLSSAAAKALTPGTHFIGMDGKEYVR